MFLNFSNVRLEKLLIDTWFELRGVAFPLRRVAVDESGSGK
jgi:hypothetical protein